MQSIGEVQPTVLLTLSLSLNCEVDGDLPPAQERIRRIHVALLAPRVRTTAGPILRIWADEYLTESHLPLAGTTFCLRPSLLQT